MKNKEMFPFIQSVLVLVLLYCSAIFAQHRGDNLAFQGLSDPAEVGVRSLGMGGAYTAMSGDLNSLFWNTAGLADVNSFQISISAASFKKSWWENQIYRPNRFMVTLPFYLEGLYIPDPANNGMWDYELAQDSSYVVNYPELGKDHFEKDAADWTRSSDGFGLDNVAAALPVHFGGKKFVLSAAYDGNNKILDFDRNDTYLDPHIGYSEYDMPARVTGVDTLRMNWYRFLRQRTGDMNRIHAALAVDLSKTIKLGAGLQILSGETDDVQQLDQVGWFDLLEENEFRFSYDTSLTRITGTSEFSASRLTLGGLFKFNNFNFGVNLYSPYTYTRKWNYTTVIEDSLGSRSERQSGEDKFEVPAGFTLGVSFSPIRQFMFSLDYEYLPYRDAKFKIASGDSLHRNWTDSRSLRFGMEFEPVDFLAVRAGYRNIPTTFVPDGAAFRDEGPENSSYTMGFSLDLKKLGRLDAAYEIRRLRYYDSYYSNTNYVVEQFDRLYFGYIFSL